jgi:hypothetical protein
LISSAGLADSEIAQGGCLVIGLYPTQSDAIPTVGTANATGDISNPGANVANYFFGADWNGQNGNVTTVGSAAANHFTARPTREETSGNGTTR